MRIIHIITDYIKASLLTAKGDIIKHDGVSAKKFPVGSAQHLMRVNLVGDNLEYIHPASINFYLQAGGDLIKYSGTYSTRFPLGFAGEIIRVNGAGNDLEYQKPGTFLVEYIREERNVGVINLISTGVTILTINMSTVNTGEFFNLFGACNVENYNAQSWSIITIEKESGVAVPKFLYNKTELDFQAQIEPSQHHTFNLSTMIQFTMGGTFTLKITGKAINNNCRIPAEDCQIFINRIKDAG